ncbi:MAG: DUF1249 domain-containing protein [Gammaproteobacteria bacterium]
MSVRWDMPVILGLDDGRLPAVWRSRPRGFAALMSLYESNHLRLSQLAGELRDLDGPRRSQVEGDCELALVVTERSPYTTTVELTYLVGALPSAPDMLLRVYHDARLVEAHGWAQRHVHPALRDWRAEAGPALDQRWARNVMLNKWLEYCLERGHRLV